MVANIKNVTMMESYVTLVQDFDNKISDSTRQFERRLNCLRRNINLSKTAITLLRELKKRKIPKEPMKVENWWDAFARENYPEYNCLKYLKCSRKTYVCLVNTLRPRIKTTIDDLHGKLRFNASKGTDVDKQIAVTLHKLSRGADCSTISTMFGIRKSTINMIIYQVVKLINKFILKTVVKIPKADEAVTISRQLEKITMIPQLLGAIESIHVPILTNNDPKFKNSKNYHSVVLQTVVDANCCFRDVSVRHPGGIEDHRVLDDSNIYKLYEYVIPKDTRNIKDLEIPYKIAASSSYPMLPWLLTEYEAAVTPGEHCFNDHLRIARWCSNAAIARLKGRFEILTCPIDVSHEIIPQIIAACCAIHNVCENNEDPCLDDWLIEMRKRDIKFPQPEKVRDFRISDSREILLRNAIKDYVETRLLLYDSDPIVIDNEFTI